MTLINRIKRVSISADIQVIDATNGKTIIDKCGCCTTFYKAAKSKYKNYIVDCIKLYDNTLAIYIKEKMK
jgi:hypothetical protein